MFDSSSLKKKLLTFTVAGSVLLTPMISRAELGEDILQKGMIHEDVQTLHEYLVELNYMEDKGSSTYYGVDTEEGVKILQQNTGLNQDGIFGKDTHEALLGVLEKSEENTELAKSRLLKNGSQGNDVKELQKALIDLNFLAAGSADGDYGENTSKAVANFQATYGLNEDGIAGKGTIQTLEKVRKGEIKKAKPKASSRSLATGRGNKIVNTAKSHLGKPYVFGAANGKSFDCSGFTYYVFKQNGINIPRTSSSQASVGSKVSKSNLQAGDLVIFSNTYKQGPSHAGIYLGNNQFIHASSGGKRVMISSLNSSYYSKKFSYGRRL